ncbi:MAG TPA: hydroxysqualene dehydroxylase HpnE [Methylibium sp.]|nr:hydroxysqualene dehydroxylase HpnE [Methylibium sp.]
MNASVAVVGAGWAGLAAAVEACSRGHAVTLYETAAIAGGRARRLPDAGLGFALDNGQHILIGAYAATLALMRRVGADPEALLLRRPLALVDAAGRGLALPPGAPVPAFVRGVLAARGWSLRERLALLAAAGGWALRGFRCDARLSVATLCAGLPVPLQRTLIEPLCIAALNTPMPQASAQVFLRVLRDALFSGPGSADLLLPRADLGALLPDAALAWLARHGATLRLGERVTALRRDGAGWVVEAGADARRADRVILAASPTEAARLAAPHAPRWSAAVEALRFEPIVTVLLRATPGTRLAQPMLMLDSGPAAPAQVLFDLGALRNADGVLAAVVSGASTWLERGLDATAEAVRVQVAAALGSELALLCRHAEKRATFLCRPDALRPGASLAPALAAAGDYVAGPYPATLEGAVRSGLAAVRSIDLA